MKQEKRLPGSKGTTLICLASSDGVFLAADDLVYVEQEGKAIPRLNNFRKVWSLDTVLVGTAGLMIHGAVEYEVQDWIAAFIAEHGGTPNKLPSSIAKALHAKLRETFKPAECLVEQGIWKSHRPGDRLLSYVVAGYTKNFGQPYVFETGIEINRNGNGFTYVSPLHHRKELPHSVRFGEDDSIERANNYTGPERSLFLNLVETTARDVGRVLPNIPEALKESVACTVSLIKVEANFNPQKVGPTVNVALVDRARRQSYTVTL